ncbi:MAG: tryptophan--tRNA ligase, partial [Candidatus Nomurabacteria bacterium]|nr:tryptophan--tRNA ligase [Candidatus Nomurabacteria bacterium]
LIMDNVAVVPGVDGRKMSKSYNNVIPLFGTDEEIKKAVMSIVTDSTGTRPENVYAIHKLFRDEAYLADLYTKHEGKYKDLKEALLADVIAFIGPMREKRKFYEEHPDVVKTILLDGRDRARNQVLKKMKDVRVKVGVDFE